MKEANTVTQGAAAIGVVTASGAENGVCLGTERRRLPVMAPGGYHWQPRVGESVLVLKAGNNGETPCILAGQSQNDTTLQPGEVALSGPGCSLKLGQNGTVCVQGTLSINGRTLDELIRSMVTAAMAEQGG
ncbi:MAG: hypothetical protein E7440_02390 [Ruminococcaceae bacterium]|nr:hypothetical protein [Oscillospiraceae bacterium]